MIQAMYMQKMLNNALGQHVSFEEVDDSRLEESPNEFTQRILFEKMIVSFENIIFSDYNYQLS